MNQISSGQFQDEISNEADRLAGQLREQGSQFNGSRVRLVAENIVREKYGMEPISLDTRTLEQAERGLAGLCK